MNDEVNSTQPDELSPAEQKNKPEKKAPVPITKETLYDKLNISIRTLDFIIAACLIGIVACFIFGAR